MRKTKIICTLGPATDKGEVLRELILAGMDVARFNFSHGTREAQKERFDRLVALREELGRPVAALLDTKGPEVRTGMLKEGKLALSAGMSVTLTTRECVGEGTVIPVNYRNLPRDLKVGATVLLDDGLIEMRVRELSDEEIVCEVQNDGVLGNQKGINLPGTKLTLPFISERDRADILFGVDNGFDFIAASFTRSAEDILEIRRLLSEHGKGDISIIAKIENAEGVSNIDEIIRVSDGVMIARGDMGVEIPIEEVPALQKKIIKKVSRSGKIVITATQMLDSMMKNPRPTRAETTDVANAIYDGTGAIMLSGETAAGAYPVQALRTMVRITLRTEADIDYMKRFKLALVEDRMNITNAISHATCTTAHDIGAAAIIPITKSGKSARMIAKYRPTCRIVACTPYRRTVRQLMLCFGVTPVLIEKTDVQEELFARAVSAAEKTGHIQSGDLVVLTAGLPLGVTGSTNMIKVHVVGDVLLYGTGGATQSVTGRVRVVREGQMPPADFEKGEILVVSKTNDALLPLMKKAAAIIVEQPGANTHTAIYGYETGKPVILGAAGVTEKLRTGRTVRVDALRGTVTMIG